MCIPIADKENYRHDKRLSLTMKPRIMDWNGTCIKIALSLLLIGGNINISSASGVSALMERGFFKPGDDVKTSCYWYWVSGNISKEGVAKDLRSMKSVGINRAFIGNQGIAELPRGPVNIKTDEWFGIVHTALATASQLGIEIGIFNGPGWSQAGGPWIKPGQSMRCLASQHAVISGGGSRVVRFAQPANFLQTVRVLAYKKTGATSLLASNATVQSADLRNVSAMLDGDMNTATAIEGASATIDFNVGNKSYVLRAVKITPDAKPIKGHASIQVKGADGNYREVKAFIIDRTNVALNVGYDAFAPVVAEIPNVQGKDFRVVLSDMNPGCGIRELELSSQPIVGDYAEKILAKMCQTPFPYWHTYKWEAPCTYPENTVVRANEVIDLTSRLDGNILTWSAPAGSWEIVRTYMAPTEITNGPTIVGDGRGLEVDRWNHADLKYHYDNFIGEILRRVPPKDRSTWKVVVCDSYETATQNFGDDFFEYFQRHFGYDPTPYLLTYDGVVVESAEKSERFLWDLRRMIADRLAYDHIGAMNELAHADGMHLWLENYGHWGFPGEFLQYGGQSDEVAGEFWSEGDLGNIENRAASSCAHIYGKGKASAESFTCGGPEYLRYPALMKQRGDKFFTEGINNTLLHVYVSQADTTKLPGFNCWFGNEFNVKNTWFSQLDLFTSYLKRCNYMLQHGNYVADVAYFIGEDAPVMTGIQEPALPKGYQFDYINAEVIEKSLRANANHEMTLPHGTRYRLLVLPPLSTMRPALIKKIRELVVDGAVVLGPRPDKSPSLQGFPLADDTVRTVADELWGREKSSRTIRAVGKGIVLSGYSIEEAFRMIGNIPDCAVEDSDSILYGHNTSPDAEIYFISNQGERPAHFTARFRVAGKVPELWNAVDGEMRDLPSYAHDGAVTEVPLRLAPLESSFVVFRKAAEACDSVLSADRNYPAFQEVPMAINAPWSVRLTSPFGEQKSLKMNTLQDLSGMSDEEVRYFSGDAVYTNTFKIPKIMGAKVQIDLGSVAVMAKVKVNGKYVGGVWTAPYCLDITDAVKSGKNTVEITVVNTWVNRLVGDSRLPQGQRRTWLTASTYNPETPLPKSGLIGPVKIMAR